MNITNSYHQLGPDFHQEILPIPVSCPALFLWNNKLATRLNISEEIKNNAADFFSGNRLLSGSTPIATAYAGHQFGGFNPQLGDGRAHLLGELNYQTGKVFKKVDIQLKGSGQTRFSRRGDGRCALKPAVREFIMSEAIFALGIPTTRALAVITTGENVIRNVQEPGAVVSRVASSHIRIGTFQYFAAREDTDSLKELLDFAIQRHFPDIAIEQPQTNKTIQFFQAVINQQIETIVHWMRVGFIHGVMNTDNMTISGETIDYGPCAMMGVYNPKTVFSSIDENGRYSFGNQPAIMQWNLTRLAETLLPLFDENIDQAIELITPLVKQITDQYENAFYQMMSKKLGIYSCEQTSDEDRELIDKLLDIMNRKELDYTQTFVCLMSKFDKTLIDGINRNQFDLALTDWYPCWNNKIYKDTALQQMRNSNPLVIPRNHHMEAVLTECQRGESPKEAEKILSVLSSPYKLLANTSYYQNIDEQNDKHHQTFCGT